MNANADAETHLNPINVDGMDVFPLAEQPAPQLLWLRIEDLVVDSRYQRPLNTGNWAAIRRIAKDFRWSRFSPVLVAPVEGGRYAVIDGQHRAHAAALCGIESIPAMVALVPPPNRPWPSSRSTPARSGSAGMPYIAPPLLLANLGRSHAAMLWHKRAVI